MSEENGATRAVTAVGMDVGSYNARVATYDVSLDHPVIVNNHDGNRYTRATVDDQPVLLMTDTPEAQKEFVQATLLQLACDSVHAPVARMRVVMACPPNTETALQACLPKDACVGVITEAAAICTAYEPAANNETILVVDGGASGLKVSVVRQTSSGGDHPVWSLVQQEVNTNVSGPKLISSLAEHVAQQFETKHRFPKGEVWSSKKAQKKLLKESESALSTLAQGATTVTVHVDGLYEGMDCQVQVSKPRWEMLSRKLATSAKDSLQKMAAAENVGSIDTVLLSGNLHAWLKPICDTVFSGLVETATGFDPAEAICLGCAKQAYWNTQMETTTMTPTQECKLSPVSIGVDDEENNTTVLIEKGTPLPAFATHKADGETKQITLWQVEPTRKQLAVIANYSGSQQLRLQLSESGELSIAVGGETLRIG
jgi:molecular chaperone DnaK (HSP70)